MTVRPRRWLRLAALATTLVVAPSAAGCTAAAIGEPDLPPPAFDLNTRVRVNQVGYLPDGPKNATLVAEAAQPVPWQLKNRAGKVLATGESIPRGMDTSSGQAVHSIDFTAADVSGKDFTLVADGQSSVPFDIGRQVYDKLPVDALSFYYPQRSGIEISDRIAPGYGRAAGHVGAGPNQGDADVPCAPGTCDYRLDVRGGWYDAGDHGKYVVNGGIAVQQLMSLYERKPGVQRDKSLRLPERGNKVPDVLDEARWELEFMLRMQVPAGQKLAGMAHHKVHDVAWTALPTDPAADPQRRELRPPSTAATLNLAAVAAQGARLFEPYDKAFAKRLLSAATAAWAAANANPKVFAPDSDSTGGGAYGDDNVDDEFYWAAAELFLSTKEKVFADFILASPVHTADVFAAGVDWRATGGLGRLDLASVPNGLPDRDRVRESVVAAARKHVATAGAQAYGMPYAPAGGKFDWGSNSLMLNNMVVMATAFDITGDAAFRDGVTQGMDYLLGRNALNQSYVTGYGERASKNQHSRWYAHQLDPKLPNPPPGTLAGGPNSSLQDELAAARLQGCKPQLCYLDDIKSWSTNELTVNWNSALAWVSSFVTDDASAGRSPPSSASGGDVAP